MYLWNGYSGQFAARRFNIDVDYDVFQGFFQLRSRFSEYWFNFENHNIAIALLPGRPYFMS